MNKTGWSQILNGDPLPWLLEIDPENPGVRYFAMIDLLNRDLEDHDVKAARNEIMISGPVPKILAAQNPDGYWVTHGPGYAPKYTGSIWQVIILAMLGADGENPRIKKACEYLLEQSRSSYGGFSLDGKNTGMVHCLQGNLIAAFIKLGWLGDERLTEAISWLARSITGEGIFQYSDTQEGVRYYRSGNSGPGFLCSANNHLPCGWGAVKAIFGLCALPVEFRTSQVEEAIRMGSEFLLSHNPSLADYPTGYNTKPSRSWFQLGFQIGYVADFLQNLEVLTNLGYAHDPRLLSAVLMLLNKQDNYGTWKMEYTYNGKTWTDIENKGMPSKWVTLRALRVLKQVYEL